MVNDDADRLPPGPNGIPEFDDVPAGVAMSPQWTRCDASTGTPALLVRTPDLAAMRRNVLSAATLAGLDARQTQQFTLAVNEIVINAIAHAGGLAMVEVSSTEPNNERDGELTVTVTDNGPGFTGTTTPELPSGEQIHGRGLWLARRLCDDIDIASSSHGTVARLRAIGQRTSAGSELSHPTCCGFDT